MSASHRSLARLPRSVFENLVVVDHSLSENGDNTNLPLHKDVAQLQKSICDKLQASKVKTVRDFFFLSTSNLLHGLDPLLTYDECLELRQRIAQHCSTNSTNALELLQQQGLYQDRTNYNRTIINQHNVPRSESKIDERPSSSSSSSTNNIPQSIPTGLSRLDEQFAPFPGLPLGSVTEIVGVAGVGKSQLANQLCLQAIQRQQQQQQQNDPSDTLPHAIYIDTEGKASQQRLQEMARLCPHLQQQLDLNRIHFYTPESTQELIDSILSQVEADMYEHHPVRLIVLDSIAAPLRRDPHLSPQYRSNAALQIAQTLKRLAHELNVAVVVINQVGSIFSNSDEQPNGNGNSEQRHVDSSSMASLPTHLQYQQQQHSSIKAALGTAWYHCVSTRILLEQQAPLIQTTDKLNHLDIVRRTATIVKSNIVQTPSRSVDFVITGQGLVPIQQS